MSEMALVLAGVAVLVAVLTLVAWWLQRRWSGAADRRIAQAVGDLDTRMESMMRELGQALARAEDEASRLRRLGDITSSLDLEEVLDRTLAATREVARADAAVVSLPAAAEDGRAVVASLGLSRDEAARHGALAGPPDGRPARAIGIAYRYDAAQLEAGDLVHAGVAVPLPGDDEPIGYLAVFTRTSGFQFGDDAVEGLEEIAARATPAIANARRYGEARRLADLDALTGLHNRRFFHETLAREAARAQRYGRRLALAVFDLDDFKAVNDRVGHLEGDAVLAVAADRIRAAVRTADIACRVGGDEFGVILPESTLADGERLAHRLQRSLATAPIGEAGRLSVSAGVAELGPEDDARSLFQRADGALYQAKERKSGAPAGGDPPARLYSARRG